MIVAASCRTVQSDLLAIPTVDIPSSTWRVTGMPYGQSSERCSTRNIVGFPPSVRIAHGFALDHATTGHSTRDRSGKMAPDGAIPDFSTRSRLNAKSPQLRTKAFDLKPAG
jgi:hypothetical protein